MFIKGIWEILSISSLENNRKIHADGHSVKITIYNLRVSMKYRGTGPYGRPEDMTAKGST